MAAESLLIMDFSLNPLAFSNGKEATKQPTSQVRNHLIVPGIFALRRGLIGYTIGKTNSPENSIPPVIMLPPPL